MPKWLNLLVWARIFVSLGDQPKGHNGQYSQIYFIPELIICQNSKTHLPTAINPFLWKFWNSNFQIPIWIMNIPIGWKWNIHWTGQINRNGRHLKRSKTISKSGHWSTQWFLEKFYVNLLDFWVWNSNKNDNIWRIVSILY